MAGPFPQGLRQPRLCGAATVAPASCKLRGPGVSTDCSPIERQLEREDGHANAASIKAMSRSKVAAWIRFVAGAAVVAAVVFRCLAVPLPVLRWLGCVFAFVVVLRRLVPYFVWLGCGVVLWAVCCRRLAGELREKLLCGLRCLCVV